MHGRVRSLENSFSFFRGMPVFVIPPPLGSPQMMNTSLTKVRPNDVLGNLPVNDQERILDWCDHEPYRDVMEKIALPAP